ncbi:MAG: glycosyltransferase family 4 protein [Ardenticatenales bacterium]|nr:glycosyltransferase family 4 protein [Ardenticatenales bacterium]
MNGGRRRGPNAARPRLTIAVDASRGFDPQPTGTETYARAVIRGLIEGGAHDYRLYMRGAPAAEADALRAAGATVDDLGAGRLWTHVRLGRAVRRRAADVLFVPAHVLPVFCPAPGVVTVHDVGHRRFPEAHTFAQRAYLELAARRHVRVARAMIADSKSTADDLVAFVGAAPERIHVVHLGVDADLVPAAPDAVRTLRTRLGLPLNAEVIVHVGTRQPRKNLARLIEALAHIRRERPDAVLVLAGRRGWGNEDLGAVARRAGVGDRVAIIDYVDRADLPALFGLARVVAVPSLHEGFGLPLLEAMACGAPVAAARASSLPEVGGDAVAWFDPHDVTDMATVIARLMGDADDRDRLTAAGRARAATFTWRRCVDATRSVLEGAAQPLPRRR